MQAVRLFGLNDIRLASRVPAPALPDGSIRIRVAAAGICGSDLHNFISGQWVSHYPVTPGHELSGVITEIKGDCGDRKLGEHVVADSRIGCGACRHCKAGAVNLCRKLGFVGEACDGGFAQEVVLPASQVLPFPSTIPLRYGALVEPLSVSLHAVHRLGAPSGASIVVCGGGTIGGLAAMLLQRRGNTVHVLERNAERQALLARHLGTTPLSAEEADWNACFGEEGPDYILDATGAHQVLEMACNRLASGGRLVLAGIFHQKPQIDFNLIVERELEILGVSAFADEMPQAIALIPDLIPTLDALITAGAPLADLPDRYAHLLAGKESRLKTLIAPNGIDATW